MTPTQKREVVKFTPNVPVEVALKFAGQGTITSTRFGDRVLYTLTDDRVMFLDLAVAQKINELGVNVREKFSICRHSGARKGADWTVWLSPETEMARAAAYGSLLSPSEEGTPAERQLQQSLKLAEPRKLAVTGSEHLEVHADVSKLPDNAHQRDGTTMSRRDGYSLLDQSLNCVTERRVETMETNGHAAAGAPTPATAEAVTNDHSYTDEIIRNQGTARAELMVATQELSRFMPIMAIEQALQRRQAIVDATQKLMHPGVDFGRVPGTDRDVLLQPGADKLCNLFGLVIQYELVKSEEDWTGERHGGTPFFFYEVRGRAYRGGFLMGEGVGSCSSWESKYRWRKAERVCPQCGKANIRKSHREAGWYCWTKTDGCGAQFEPGDPAIESQESGRKENPDMADLVNTVLKMAYKRSKVSTTINATSASEFFTQDIDEQRVSSTEQDSHDRRNANGGKPREMPGSNRAGNIGEIRVSSPSAEEEPKIWVNRAEMKRMFEAVRERVGEVVYLTELARFSVRKAEDFRNESAAWACYKRLSGIAKEGA